MLVCQKVTHSAHPINFAQHDLSLENNGGKKHAQNELYAAPRTARVRKEDFSTKKGLYKILN